MNVFLTIILRTYSFIFHRAFSVVETIESMRAIKTGTLKELSVQQVIDCSQGFGLKGCGGGDTCTALEWMNDVS